MVVILYTSIAQHNITKSWSMLYSSGIFSNITIYNYLPLSPLYLSLSLSLLCQYTHFHYCLPSPAFSTLARLATVKAFICSVVVKTMLLLSSRDIRKHYGQRWCLRKLIITWSTHVLNHSLEPAQYVVLNTLLWPTLRVRVIMLSFFFIK